MLYYQKLKFRDVNNHKSRTAQDRNNPRIGKFARPIGQNLIMFLGGFDDVPHSTFQVELKYSFKFQAICKMHIIITPFFKIN